ncbi:hypothetical protein N0V93_003393 [Gnomoniopsis smithogilvyi]|uniref:Uncharacterized protein n=1 Tax=Gnomoniopsis smithogilvyi TaxID=1191159 RepID=A0A9W8YYD0_9PEZI|nr:hypothetical protein N0V93_003393 [Gnomoniopsis smithogilvyi]
MYISNAFAVGGAIVVWAFYIFELDLALLYPRPGLTYDRLEYVEHGFSEVSCSTALRYISLVDLRANPRILLSSGPLIGTTPFASSFTRHVAKPRISKKKQPLSATLRTEVGSPPSARRHSANCS